MRLTKTLLALLLCAPALAPAQDEESSGPFTVSGGGWVLSDYVWRGVSQTQEDAAVQAEFAVAHESGFYVGTWGSMIDFTPDAEEDGIDYEIDVYVGWSREFSDTLSLDLNYTRIMYPGQDEGIDYEYDEFAAALGFGGNYTASVAYSDDIVNLGGEGIYYNLAGEWEIGESGVAFGAAVGHYDLEDALGDSYQDWMLSLSRGFGPVTAAVMYTDTENYSEAIAEGMGDPSLADGRVSVSLGIEF